MSIGLSVGAEYDELQHYWLLFTAIVGCSTEIKDCFPKCFPFHILILLWGLWNVNSCLETAVLRELLEIQFRSFRRNLRVASPAEKIQWFQLWLVFSMVDSEWLLPKLSWGGILCRMGWFSWDISSIQKRLCWKPKWLSNNAKALCKYWWITQCYL